MKIGVFGGAFNPIHNGHIQLADGFSQLLGFDKLLLVPSNISPHKSVAEFADAAHRLKMCELAAAHINKCEVCDNEIKRAGVSYTVDTLKWLKKKYPSATLYLLCGSDMFLSLLRWHKPFEIISLAVICAVRRANESERLMLSQKRILEAAGANVVLLDMKINAVSSTEIRRQIKSGYIPVNSLSDEVAEYIAEHRLYTREETADV